MDVPVLALKPFFATLSDNMLPNELIRKNLEEGGNCGTVSMLGLLHPHFPNENHIEVVRRSNKVEAILASVALELFKHNVFCFIHGMNEVDFNSPSAFFTALHQDAKEDLDGASFIGGVVRMNYQVIDSGKQFGHVVMVRDYDESNNTATLVDTAPFDNDMEPVRTIALPLIDQLVTQQSIGQVTRAYGLTSMPISHPAITAPENRQFVEQSIHEWRSTIVKLQGQSA